MASCGETVPTQELNEKLLNFSAIAHDLTPKVWICFTLGGERGWNTYHGTLVLEVGHEKWKLHLITAGVQLRLLYDEEFDSLLRCHVVERLREGIRTAEVVEWAEERSGRSYNFFSNNCMVFLQSFMRQFGSAEIRDRIPSGPLASLKNVFLSTVGKSTVSGGWLAWQAQALFDQSKQKRARYDRQIPTEGVGILWLGSPYRPRVSLPCLHICDDQGRRTRVLGARDMYICPVYWHVEWKKQKKPEEGFALKIYTVGYKARSKGSWVPEEEKGLFEDWYLSISGGEESADGPAYADLVLKQKYRDATIWEAVSEGGYHVGLRVKVVAGFQGWYMQHFRDGRLAIGNSEALKKNIESLGQAEWVDGRAMRYEKQLQARYARPTPNSVGPLWSTRCLGFSEHKMITTSDLRVSDSHDLEVSRIGLGSTVLPKGDPRIVDWHVEWKEEGKPEEGFALTIYIVRQGYQPEERPRSFEDWYLSISQVGLHSELVIQPRFRDATIWEVVFENNYHMWFRVKGNAWFEPLYLRAGAGLKRGICIS